MKLDLVIAHLSCFPYHAFLPSTDLIYTFVEKKTECLTEGKWEFDGRKWTEALSSCDKPSQQGHKQLCHLPRTGVPSSIRDS